MVGERVCEQEDNKRVKVSLKGLSPVVDNDQCFLQ